MKTKVIKKPLFILFSLIVIGVVVLSAGVFWGRETTSDKNRQSVKQEEVKIGDCVTCITGSEDIVVEDPKEYGPPKKSERIADGIITDIQDGEVYIKIEGIADYWYIKKDSSWVPDLSVRKRPPYDIGDIYKCKPLEIKEYKKGLVTYKYGTIIKKISSG